jgi:hypothetical protein
VKQDRFSAVFEVCLRTCLHSCECFFRSLLAVNVSLSGVDKQDFRPAPRLKKKRNPLQTPDGASSSFASPNHVEVLSDSDSDTEDIGVPPQQNSR